MKTVIILCDGMADMPCSELGDQTPMAVADKPVMDKLAKQGEVGLVKTVADGLSPGSDVANLSVMGYDPRKYYTGRSPLEAVSMGIPLTETDYTLRCNFVTLSDEPDYTQKKMLDYCADDISTPEAKELVESIQAALGNAHFEFRAGISYRHCLVWHGGKEAGSLTPPHDISGQRITSFLPKTTEASPLYTVMMRSYEILSRHPVNQERIKRGKRPANSIWLWGQGKKPLLPSFEELHGVKGAVVSAVDLIKGIGRCAQMEVCPVDGATGYIDTNFEGKTQAALDALAHGADFVYIHIEAPDECGHRKEASNKVRAIELIDRRVLIPLISGLQAYDDYRIMVLPDHPTPISTGTHSADPVPYLLYQKSGGAASGVSSFTEQSAASTGVLREEGHMLIRRLFEP